MKQINLLDCTLRDGGYINNFYFGIKCIESTIKHLNEAGIDIVEVGFLEKNKTGKDFTKYGSILDASEHIKADKTTKYVAMIQLGKFDVNELPNSKDTLLDGIRLTFHYNEIEQAEHDAKIIQSKGYLLFFQPVGTTAYTKGDLEELIKVTNVLNPFAFYLVDTLGILSDEELTNMFDFVNARLNKNMFIGFHSHNNLQLSFANAKTLCQHLVGKDRKIIIDSSIYGMGRGAGNLCTELIATYLNKKHFGYYKISPILKLIDLYYKNIKQDFTWGYSIEYFLSANYGCHPNYSSFLLNKQTITIEDIDELLLQIPSDKKDLYDEKFISNLYIQYLSSKTDFKENIFELSSKFKGANIILIAPGENGCSFDKNKLKELELNDYFVISINHISKVLRPDFLFFSNRRKYEYWSNAIFNTNDPIPLILSSNVNQVKSYSKNNKYYFDYLKYLSKNEAIKDNAGLMCVKLVKDLGAKNIFLIGFDGFDNKDFSYRNDKFSDYGYPISCINKCMSDELFKFGNINFLSKSKYEKI